jgi:hypothetical protein
MFQDDVKIKNGFADIHNFKKKRCEVGRHTDVYYNILFD